MKDKQCRWDVDELMSRVVATENKNELFKCDVNSLTRKISNLEVSRSNAAANNLDVLKIICEMREENKELTGTVTKLWDRISAFEMGKEIVSIPDVEHSIYLNHLSTKDALQHLINCLGITYSPDKFNQGDDK